MVNKVTFVGFRGGDRPLDPPLVTQIVPVTPPKFWPITSLTHKEVCVYFALQGKTLLCLFCLMRQKHYFAMIHVHTIHFGKLSWDK